VPESKEDAPGVARRVDLVARSYALYLHARSASPKSLAAGIWHLAPAPNRGNSLVSLTTVEQGPVHFFSKQVSWNRLRRAGWT